MLWKKQKKKFFTEVAVNMSIKFKKKFLSDKVRRKWYGLLSTYKKTKDNNNKTGRGPAKFQFFTEIDSLIGSSADIIFPVTATAAGVEVNQPEVRIIIDSCT